MQYLQKRQTTPEYLAMMLEQKTQDLQATTIKLASTEEQLRKKTEMLTKTSLELEETKKKLSRQVTNLTMANKKLQQTIENTQGLKAQLEFNVENLKLLNSKLDQQHKMQTDAMRSEYENSKKSLNQKIHSLETTIEQISQAYHIDSHIKEDRTQILKDFHKEQMTEGNTVRATIIQNQKLNNELEFQSKQTVLMLQKNQKLQQQVAHYKREVEIHRQIENDLVKRSSLSQNLVKQLNKKLKQCEAQLEELTNQLNDERSHKDESLVMSQVHNNDSDNEFKFKINELNIEISNHKNTINYLENKLLLHETKYESLAVILSQYLEILMLRKGKGIHDDYKVEQVAELNLGEVRQKPVIEWKEEETELVVRLLLEQIKPLMSVKKYSQFKRKSLTSFPITKNVNISLVDQPPKEPINLPKIATQHEQIVEGKKVNRFKNVPLDISTKIVRSDLRSWGTKVEYGGIKKSKTKSQSVYEHKSMLN